MLLVQQHLSEVSATIIRDGASHNQLWEVLGNIEGTRAQNRIPHGKTGIDCIP